MAHFSRIRITIVLFCLLTAPIPFLLGSAPPAATMPPASGLLLISGDSLMAGVRWLADDAREGRMTGTPGAEAAATWIAEKFEALGLEPAGDDGTFFQSFEATVGVRLGEENALEITGVKGLGSLRLEKDYLPFGFTEAGTLDVPLVFAGYGITDEALGYDDYAGLDVEGKAVLLLRHEPQQNDEQSVFNGTAWSRHALFRNKAINARDHGAVAMLVFTGPLSEDYDRDRLTPLSGAEGIGGGNLLAVHVKKTVGEKLFRAEGQDVRAWMEAVDRDLAPRSFAFGDEVRVKLVTSVSKDRRPTVNVVGLRTGRDPHQGAVLIGAHYDHLGRGNSSSLAPDRLGEVHNGADDNASGVSAMLELARVFSLGEKTERTLIFSAFSGEELGLLGSAHMAADPPYPADYIQTMINLDMVGRPTKQIITVGGVGSSPDFPALLARLDEETPLSISTSSSGFGASDHTSFYAKNIPVLFFFSGLHGDYHKPSDDWDRIDPEGFLEVTRLVYRTALHLANQDDRVAFVRAAEDSAGARPSGRGGGRGYGPWLGVVPEFGDREEPGVAISGTSSGSPAEKAGLAGGDVILRFDDRVIEDLHTLTYSLREHEPGDTVRVTVLRGAEELVFEVVLASREKD